VIGSHRRYAVALGLVVLLVALARMLVPEAIGLSDQGDAHRLTCQLGLEVDVAWRDRITPEVSSTAYVPFQWERHTWYGETCGANGTGQPYRSSQITLLRAAQLVTPVLGFDAALDLRALAVVCSVLLAGLASLLYLALPGRPALRMVTVGLVVLALLDRRVAGVFASGYSEPAALLGLLAVVVASLFVLRRRVATLPGLVALAGTGAFTLTSKSQMVGVLPLIVLALVWRPSRAPDQPSWPIRWQRTWFLGWARARAAGLVLSLVLVVLTASYLGSQPPRFEEVNRHNQLFHTLLALDDQPEEDLAWFGLDPALAPLSGTNITGNAELVGSPAYEPVADIDQGDILRFYAAHPGRLALLARRGLDAAAASDPSAYLASYGRDSGEPPHTFENRIWLWSALFEIADAVPAVLLVVVFGSLFVTVQVVRRTDDPEVEGPALVAAGVALSAVLSFWVAVLGDGTVELARHLIIADVLVAWCVPFAIAARFGARRPRPELALPPDVATKVRVDPAASAPPADDPVTVAPVTVGAAARYNAGDAAEPVPGAASFDELFERFVANDPDGPEPGRGWKVRRWRRTPPDPAGDLEAAVADPPPRPSPPVAADAPRPPRPPLPSRTPRRLAADVAPSSAAAEPVAPEHDPSEEPSATDGDADHDWLQLSPDDFLAALRTRSTPSPHPTDDPGGPHP